MSDDAEKTVSSPVGESAVKVAPMAESGAAEDETAEDFYDDELEEDFYTFDFEDATNPLDLVAADQDTSNNGELYQQFERLEYEALAQRKRKHQQQTRHEKSAKKVRGENEFLGATLEEINELMEFGGGSRRKSKAFKKRGRRRGFKSNHSPEVSAKLGDATLLYASGSFDEAIPLLEEVVRLAPNVADSYQMLGLIYESMGNTRKAMNFYMFAAHLNPKDSSLWKKLVTWSIGQKDIGQVNYFLAKAITADPQDLGLRFSHASLYYEMGEHQKAAESYQQVVELYPANLQARQMAAQMYESCGQLEKAANILEEYINCYPAGADINLIKLLVDLQMKDNKHDKALKVIEVAERIHACEPEFSQYLKLKAAICYAQLGRMEHTEAILKDFQMEDAKLYKDVIMEVADMFMNMEGYSHALRYYFMLEDFTDIDKGSLHLKIAKCFVFINERRRAIEFFYKALHSMEDNIDVRLSLASLLVEEGQDGQAISLLSPSKISDVTCDWNSTKSKSWWFNGKVKLQLAKIYHAKGMLVDFVDVIFPCVKETLGMINLKRKKKRGKKKLSTSVLFQRAKLLDDLQTDSVLHKFRPIAKSSDILKAQRAKKSLEKREELRKRKKEAALAAGLDWHSDDSEDEGLKAITEPPLPGFLKHEEDYQLILDLCAALVALREYVKALEIIHLTLRCTIALEKKEELRSLCAKIAYNTRDPNDGYNIARYIVHSNPYSITAWNFYSNIINRFEENFPKSHLKLLNRTHAAYPDCLYAMIVHGNHFTMLSQHQAAAREYLKAYKRQPENSLINLCIGSSLINLSLGHRLQEKHRTVVQGLAFLYECLRLSPNSQEAMYNIARAFHQVGLETLAAQYYEKVLSMEVEDHSIPKLPFEDLDVAEERKSGYCSLQREAAYNLHLIYKRSGAVDLARQVLKDYCWL